MVITARTDYYKNYLSILQISRDLARTAQKTRLKFPILFLCPFHEEVTPSMSWRHEGGECLSCGASGTCEELIQSIDDLIVQEMIG